MKTISIRVTVEDEMDPAEFVVFTKELLGDYRVELISGSSSLEDFPVGAKVFIAQSADDWMGVQIIGVTSVSEDLKLRVLWTGGIPGYAVDDEFVSSPDVMAYEHLTVDAAIAQTERLVDIVPERTHAPEAIRCWCGSYVATSDEDMDEHVLAMVIADDEDDHGAAD